MLAVNSIYAYSSGRETVLRGSTCGFSASAARSMFVIWFGARLRYPILLFVGLSELVDLIRTWVLASGLLTRDPGVRPTSALMFFKLRSVYLSETLLGKLFHRGQIRT